MSVFYNDKALEKDHMKELLNMYILFSRGLLFKELEMEADIPNIHWG